MAAAGRPDTDQNHAGTTLRIERRAGGVAWVTMAREAVFNAFDETLIAELDTAFATLGADAAVRVVVLAGAGRHFSAGADLKWMQRAAAASREANEADAQRFAAMLAQIVQCPKPTVARIQGAALGGGVGLACACDIAIAADDAQFAVSEVKFGILPAVIGPHLVNAVGRRQAQRLSLTAERIGAAEALAIGLVQRVVAAAELDTAVQAMVQQLRVGGPLAQAEVKRLFARLQPGQLTPELQTLTTQTIARVRGGAEAREGFDAFLAKRPPPWLADAPQTD